MNPVSDGSHMQYLPWSSHSLISGWERRKRISLTLYLSVPINNKIYMTWPRRSTIAHLVQWFVTCPLSLLTQQAAFPVVIWKGATRGKLNFPCKCSGLTSAPAWDRASYAFALYILFFLARLKKFLRKNQMCKRYAARSPSVGMSMANSTILWNSFESVGSRQTQITCSWETTWTEATTRWKQWLS